MVRPAGKDTPLWVHIDRTRPLFAGKVAALRAATAGMIKPEIEQAVTKFRTTGKLPKRDEFSWCRNPETGEYSERLLDPWELKGWPKDAGFDVQLRRFFRKMALRALSGVNFRPLNMRLFAMRPFFALVARKPKRRAIFRCRLSA